VHTGCELGQQHGLGQQQHELGQRFGFAVRPYGLGQRHGLVGSVVLVERFEHTQRLERQRIVDDNAGRHVHAEQPERLAERIVFDPQRQQHDDAGTGRTALRARHEQPGEYGFGVVHRFGFVHGFRLGVHDERVRKFDRLGGFIDGFGFGLIDGVRLGIIDHAWRRPLTALR